VLYYEGTGEGESAVEADIAVVVREFLSGVTLTSVSYEGESGSGAVNRKPGDLLPLLKQARDALRGLTRVDRAQAGFGGRFLTT